jgi:hypothetical protein
MMITHNKYAGGFIDLDVGDDASVQVERTELRHPADLNDPAGAAGHADRFNHTLHCSSLLGRDTADAAIQIRRRHMPGEHATRRSIGQHQDRPPGLSKSWRSAIRNRWQQRLVTYGRRLLTSLAGASGPLYRQLGTSRDVLC